MKLDEIEKLKREEWKDIKEYEGLYQVSNFGRVKSLDKLVWNGHSYYKRMGEILKLRVRKDGYISVMLCKLGKQKEHKVHRLVAQAFIANPNNYPQVNHKKEFEKWNNKVENLEWCTREYNMNYGTRKERVTEKLKNKVYQYTSSKKFVREWESAKECGLEGFDPSTISKCCRNLKKYKTHKGFIWAYLKLEGETI